MARSISRIITLAFAASAVWAGPILFGVNGGHPNPDGSPLSINNGWLVILDQSTANVTPVGHPAGFSKLSGIAFEPNGDLFVTALTGGAGFPPPLPSSPTTTLLKLNPATGALITNVGMVTVGGNPLQIADLAVQPGTGTLFGISASSSGDFSAAGNLYTINTLTGAATLVGATGDFFGAIAFAPDGTLYMTAADLDNMGNIVNTQLKTLNPLTAVTLTSVATTNPPGALGIRPDGVIFAGNGDAGAIFTINRTTGLETPVGNTGLNFVGDLAFETTPEPGTVFLSATSLLGAIAFRIIRHRRRTPTNIY